MFMEGRADISGGEGLIFLEGRADISEGRADFYEGVCLCLWRGGLIFLEGRADIS